MISQKHDDDMQQGEQRVSVVEEKQTTVSEGRSRQTPALPRRWILVLLCILGIGMPMVLGSMLYWPWGVFFENLDERIFFLVFLLMAAIAAIAAFLLGFVFRRWWAGLLVPVAWSVGEFVGAVLLVGWDGHFWIGQSVIIGAFILLAPLGVIGALLGKTFRRWWEMRQQQL